MSDSQNKSAGVSQPVDRRCTLVLPGLLDLPASMREPAFAEVDSVSELEWFFSRAQRQQFSVADFASVLFALFDVEVEEDCDLPVGAVAFVSDAGGKRTAQWCLCADPVQLIPDRDQLVLMGPETLSLSQAEADQLVAELNAQFSAEGWQIEAHTPTRWYLQLDQAPGLRTTSLAQVRGQAINGYLPGGTNGKHWHRLMNEVQMVLHGSIVNRERQASGQPAISSLWFWGCGETPTLQHSRWSKLWSNEPLSLGLATLSSTPRKDLPGSARQWLDSAISPGEHLIVLDTLFKAWQQGDMALWAQQVSVVNREWIVPMLNALRSNEINELSICTCNGSRFTLSRSGMRRWWRRKKSLATLAAQT
jgi:hypothetical protein